MRASRPLPAARGTEARCAVMAIDLRGGDAPEWLRREGVVRELCDVAAIPGRRAPVAIVVMGDEIRRVVSFDA